MLHTNGASGLLPLFPPLTLFHKLWGTCHSPAITGIRVIQHTLWLWWQQRAAARILGHLDSPSLSCSVVTTSSVTCRNKYAPNKHKYCSLTTFLNRCNHKVKVIKQSLVIYIIVIISHFTASTMRQTMTLKIWPKYNSHEHLENFHTHN